MNKSGGSQGGGTQSTKKDQLTKELAAILSRPPFNRDDLEEEDRTDPLKLDFEKLKEVLSAVHCLKKGSKLEVIGDEVLKKLLGLNGPRKAASELSVANLADAIPRIDTYFANNGGDPMFQLVQKLAKYASPRISEYDAVTEPGLDGGGGGGGDALKFGTGIKKDLLKRILRDLGTSTDDVFLITEEEAEAMVCVADRDGSGLIDPEEFVRLVMLRM